MYNARPVRGYMSHVCICPYYCVVPAAPALMGSLV